LGVRFCDKPHDEVTVSLPTGNGLSVTIKTLNVYRRTQREQREMQLMDFLCFLCDLL
jgi:hypothetical protein